MALLTVFLTLLSIYIGVVATENPGLQIRITERGVQRAAQVALDLMSSRLQDSPLPDITDTSGDLHYWFTGLKIASFQKPSTDVDVSPTRGITWNARNAAIRVSGNWRFRYKKGFVRISDSGGISVSATGISFSVSFTLGMSASGKPTVRTTRCTTSIGDLDVDVSGSPLSFIYNLFIRLGEGKIKDEAVEEICEAAREAIDGQLNDDLSEVEVMSTVANDFLLDYRLIGVPRFANGHFDSYHKGEFRSKVNPVPFTSVPAPFPLHTVGSRMVNIWGSDYVINSFAYATFKRRLLQHQISDSEIPSEVLQTSCQGNTLCLGRLFPELKNKYPNGKGELNIKATRAPTVQTSPAGISLALFGEIALQLRAQNGQVHPILVLSLNLNMTVSVYLDGNVVRGSVISFCPVVNVKETTINNIPANTFQALFDIFVKESIVGSLNEIGLKGINIPHLENTRFTNTILVKNEGNLMFAADVIWAPDSPNTPVTPSPPESDATRQPLAACYDPALLTVTTTTPSPPSSTSTPTTMPTERKTSSTVSPTSTTSPLDMTSPLEPGSPRSTVSSSPKSVSSTRGRPSTNLQSSASQCMTTCGMLWLCVVIFKLLCI